MKQKIIYTIGHSVHEIGYFLKMLQSFGIHTLVDIRHYPGSKRFPHFNKDYLETFLSQNNIVYKHLIELGGRRKPRPDSVNTAWRLPAFRGYADHMETDTFKKAVAELETLALTNTCAYMCSEAVWWSCHRALVSDYLKAKGWKVLHIMKENKADEHPYSSAAQIVNGQLSYKAADLFNDDNERTV